MDAANTEQAFVKDRNSILPNISAGLVVGILVVFIVASYAALIFSGDLDRFLAQGIGILLFGAFIPCCTRFAILITAYLVGILRCRYGKSRAFENAHLIGKQD